MASRQSGKTTAAKQARPSAVGRPATSASAATVQVISRSDQILAKALTDAAMLSDANVKAFWQAWQEDGGQLINSTVEFEAQCSDALAALRLMSRVIAVLTGPKGSALGRELGDRGQHLVQTLMSAALDRFIRLELWTQHQGGADDLTLTVGYRVTAEMLSAVASNAGLLWQHRPGADEPYHVDNVRWDRPAHEFGSEDAAFDAWMAEILAWCDARRRGQSLLDRILNPFRLKQHESPDPRVVRLQIDRVEREFGIRPLLAAVADEKGSLSTNMALRTRIHNELNVSSALVTLADQERLDKAFKRAETTARGFMKQLFEALHPPDSSTSTSPVGVNPRSQVFISYAHVDGTRWMSLLTKHLSALHLADAIEPWSDEAIDTGDAWRHEIENAMAKSACAVLILTPGGCGQILGLVMQRSPGFYGARRGCGSRVNS